MGTATLNSTPLSFTSGPCPWVWGDPSFGSAVFAAWSGTQFIIIQTLNGITQGTGSDPSVQCNGTNFTGSVTLSNGSTVSFS